MAKASDKTAGDSLRRVFLVDDHLMLLGGLAMLLGQIPRCMVCGEATTAAEALAGIPAARPVLVIMDLSLPDKNGLELIKEIHFIMPELRTLTFSTHDEILYAKRTIKARSKGYLMKRADTTLLAAAVNRVLDGGVYLSPQVLEHFLRNPAGGASLKTRLKMLNERELRIFELIGGCYTISQISRHLNIRTKTINAHCGKIRAKLNLADTPSLMWEAVLWVRSGNNPDLSIG